MVCGRHKTPQLFQAGPLLAALRAALREQKHRTGTANVPVTDEAAAMERPGPCAAVGRGVASQYKNHSPRRPASGRGSVRRAIWKNTMRVGQGFDVHAFCDGDHLMLGGVRIPFYPRIQGSFGRRCAITRNQ